MNGSQVARAYDAAAASYDWHVATDAWVRRRLWAHYARVFRPGQRILDVACGTGLDALFLAGRGMQVTGIDVSAEMIARLRDRVQERGLSARVTVHVLDLADLAADASPLRRVEQEAAPFDGIISAFAGLNTLPDLNAFAVAAAGLLKPEGRLIVHMLNRFSIWEWLGLMVRGRWHRAWQLGRKPQRVFVIGGLPVTHTLYGPQQAWQSFAPYFTLAGAYSIGAFHPPADYGWMPARALKLLDRLEQQASGWRPFLNWGRFFVLDMVKVPGRMV